MAETDVREPPLSVLDLPHQLSHLDQVTVGVAHVAADFLTAVDWRGQKLLHSWRTAPMAATGMFRKLDTRPGSEGVHAGRVSNSVP